MNIQDMMTRPSTSGKEVMKMPLNLNIKRSFSFKKEKLGSPHGRNKLEEIDKEWSSAISQQIDQKIQYYYKSIEPYFKKKKHISGYEAELHKRQGSESSKTETSERSPSIIITDSHILEQANRTRTKTRENWFVEDNNRKVKFTQISEEESISDKNSYGLKLMPKKTKKKKQKKVKNGDIKSIVSSFF
jgi:hypothetical protein